MKTNPVKQKLQRGEASFGTWLSLGNLFAARLLARMGWDWLTLDLEHSPVDLEQAAAIFGAVADAGCVPLVRVPEGSHTWIKRVLDAGAMGIVVPMVDTVEQARTAIAAAKYPPQGNRSAGGGMHSMNFAATADEYYARANDEILVVLQTESPRGVANAEAIYSLPGCDAIFIGPVDLRFQMRAPDGTFPTAEEHEILVQRVIQVGQRVGTPTGIHAMDPQSAVRRAEQGMRFIAVGSDLRMMTQKAQEALDIVCPKEARREAVRY
jgi:4-hydroxy-2-oxoheptanedioate aldolase